MVGAPAETEQADAWGLARGIAGRPIFRTGRFNGKKRKLEYGASSEREISTAVPSGPAAVMLYDEHGMCRVLANDVDVPGPEGARLTHQLVAMFERCGAQVIVDRSPAGKHHVYLPLRDRLGVNEAVRLVKAIARRFPGVDVLPHSTGAISGCIRPPGSPYKDGNGWQQLVTPIDTARRTLMTRNGSDVLGRLESELSDELALVAREQMKLAQPIEELQKDLGALPEPFGSTVLSPRMALIAREGLYEQAGYADRSSARMAVLCGAVRAGIRDYRQIAARIEDGRWPGLAAMFQNATTPMRKLLIHEWKKALLYVGARQPSGETVRHCNTSEVEVTRGGTQGGSSFDEHRFIRRWRATLLMVERTELRGRGGLHRRFLLRMLAAAAHEKGSRYIEFGVRSLSLGMPIDASTVSRVLADLRADPDPWIVLEKDAEGTRADLYSLRIPDRHRATAEAAELVSGKSHAMRPAFRELGAAAALVFEAIERGAGSVLSASTTSGVSRSAAHEAAELLERWGLIERDREGRFIARPDRLSEVAERTGAVLVVAQLIVRFRKERELWREYLASCPVRSPDEAWWQATMRDGPPGHEPRVAIAG